MAFVKLVRLERPRDMRERTDNSDPSVTEAALACGFTNLGHFAGDYFKGFGERHQIQQGGRCTDKRALHDARRRTTIRSAIG